MDKDIKENWEKNFRLRLYNFKACTPDYNEINVQEMLDFISHQISKAREDERRKKIEEIRRDIEWFRLSQPLPQIRELFDEVLVLPSLTQTDSISNKE